MTVTRNYLLGATALLGGAVFAMATPAWAIDWSTVPGKEIVLLYPGQSAWEWVLTQSDHSGAKKFREGKVCNECHEGEQADMGALIVSGEKLEPHPIPGKRGSFPIMVKTAHDAERLYVHIAWTPQELPDAPKMDERHVAKVNVMIDDGAMMEMTRGGCWSACHADAESMAFDDPDRTITKYLSRSRTKLSRRGGGLNLKPDAELAELAGQGVFLEYWQAGLTPSGDTEAVGGHILGEREENASSAVTATAERSEAAWQVTLSRPLEAGGTFEKAIVPDKIYTLGFAIHEAYADKRFHHVSFGYTLRLDGGEADLVAVAQ